MAIAPRRVITSVAEYDGAAEAIIAATQLQSSNVSAAQARRTLAEWIDFLARPTPIRRLEFASRVPQRLLDAIVGQTALRSLTVKWGPYADLEPLTNLPNLRELALRGASSVVDLVPLTRLVGLESLVLDGAHRADPEVLSAMTWLRELAFGDAYPGSQRWIRVRDFEWLRPLVRLRRLDLVMVAASQPDLRVMLDLPELEHLGLSMRREYRMQVRDLATESLLFASVEADFSGRERFIADLRANRVRRPDAYS